MKKVLSLFALILLSVSAFSQPAVVKEWTLEECIVQALNSNVRVRHARLNAEQARTNFRRSVGIALPDLNGAASHVYNFGKTIDPFTNTFANDKVLSENFSVSSSLNLFSGFRTVNTISQSNLSYQASLFDIKKVENDVSLAVTSQFLQIIFNYELVEVARKQLLLTNEQVQRTKKLVDAGASALGALYDIQAQEATEELNLVNAENQYLISNLDLAQLLNLDDFSAFKIKIPLIEIPPAGPGASIEQIYQSAYTLMPQVKSAELKLKSGLKGIRVAKGGISPSLSVFGSLGTGYSGANKEVDQAVPNGFDTIGFTPTLVPVLTPAFDLTYKGREFSDQISDNFNRSVGFRLSVPILNGFQNRTDVQRARIDFKRNELDLIQTKIDLRKEVQKAYLDANASLKKYNSAKKALQATQESFRYTQQRFDVGSINSFDYNAGKTRLSKAESDVLQSKYEYIFKLKVLDFYMGIPLTL